MSDSTRATGLIGRDGATSGDRLIDRDGATSGDRLIDRDGTTRGDRLIGRAAERAELNAFLDRVRAGGDALLLHGDPGVGKTALLDDATAGASGLDVRRVAAGPLEVDVERALLHALLEELGEPDHALLEDPREPDIALLEERREPDHAPPDEPHAAFLAARLTRMPCGAPVLVVFDDLQWGDAASLAVLDMLGRRARDGGGFGLLGAARGPSPPAALSWPAREIPPLDAADASRLADRLSLPAVARRRVVAAAAGNPQAVLDFGAVPPPGFRRCPVPPLPPGPLRRAYAEMLVDLPPGTRHSLLIMALAEEPPPGLPHLEPARPLLDGTGSRFRHALLRGAVIAVATAGERARAHRTLAELAGDPLRRARHRAEASLEPDEAVAGLLEEGARQSLRDGATTEAVTALMQAAEQSPEASSRSRRLARAAYVGATLGGDLRFTVQLLEAARTAEPDAARSLAAAVAAAHVLIGRHGDVDSAHRLLRSAVTDAVRVLGPDDPELSDAAVELVETARLAARDEVWQSCDEVLARLGELSPLARLWSRVHRGSAAADRASLDELVSGIDRETDPARIYRTAVLALVTDRGPRCHRALRRAAAGGEAGRLALTGWFALAFDGFAAGRWDQAVGAAEEVRQRSEVRGDEFTARLARMIQLHVSALRGDGARIEAETGRIVSWATPRGLGALAQWGHHVRAAAALAAGDFEDAFQHATAATTPGTLPSDPVVLRCALDLIESATRVGRSADAFAHATALQAVAPLSDRLALLAAGAAAMTQPASLELFPRALALPAAVAYPFEAARLHLSYGELLRRTRSRSQARDELAAALTIFRRLGATPWAERAARELEAAASRRGRHLTAQEREVADLAAAGRSNRQIADRLLISPVTVAAHLRQVYRKLAITSRSTLRDALTPGGAP
ncbi:helix-turn-helix transcriptional regulator [Actinoplanes solisilvae]|uniref:helix-turn-helix transcriptional regulator n=1 Tax=Actinoplanes solisilvae TaxID=2486853 RepID=UPI0013E3E422|nr:LuxR family transcriptional regulator [Actinoplanes solisilvae]